MIRAEHLAVKYRPTTFGEVVGQRHVVGSLRGMLERQRVPPVFLFHGPRSTGKTTLGRLLAKYLNCLELKEGEPCERCPSCQAMKDVLAGRPVHPDVTELNVALHGGIDTIRNLENLAPQAPRFRMRIFILDEAHRITGAAFQGALKLLEDPPRRTIFILSTTNVEQIPDTIMSRCEVFQLSPLNAKLVAKQLYKVAIAEKFKPGSPENLKKLCQEVAGASGGHLREALGILDNIHSYVHSQKGPHDWKKLLPQVIDETPELAPYIVVQKYMQGVLGGNRSLAFLAISRTHNHEYFLRRVLETWQLIIAQWIDEERLFDRSKFWMLRDVTDFPDVSKGRKIISNTSDIEDILESYTQALERVKTYTTDAVALLQATTLRVIRKVKRWEKL